LYIQNLDSDIPQELTHVHNEVSYIQDLYSYLAQQDAHV
jgi:hypothetical protein